MRFFILIALCLAVASANYANKQRFNRLLRQLQKEQDQEQGYSTQGHNYEQENEYDDEDQEDEEEKYQRRQQGQCKRKQRYGSLNLNDDDERETEYDSSEQDDEDQYENRNKNHQRQYQREEQEEQGRGNRQQEQQKKKQHQCQAKYELLQTLEQVNSQLAAKLYKQAKQENDDKNTVVGPAAVQLALAAVKRGARGNTKRQIQRVLGAGLTPKQSQQAHAALQQSLQGRDPSQKQTGENQKAKVKTTTTIFINQGNRAQQKFIETVKTCLNVQVKKCDFHRQPQQCRQQINQHVAQKTDHKLQHVVPQDAVTENTKMIVVNTVQLKAKWGKQFRNQQHTKQGRFYPLGSKQAKNIQVLQTQGQFNYYEDNQVQVVGVPTQGEELTLYVIVPKDKDGLNQIEKTQIQNGQQLKQLLDNTDQQQERVELQLPKFQIKHKIDAKRTLRQEGAKDAFDADEADLSGINGQQQEREEKRHRNQRGENDDEDQEQQEQDQQQRQHQLHINKLIHQATIKVDEQGISAAKPKHQGQQQGRYQQDQYEHEDDEQENEDDEQQDKYEHRQELEEEIFGQRRGRQGRHHQRQQQHHRRQQGNQYQDQEQGEKRVKVNRAFAFAVKHNPSNQIVLVGRVVDATQTPKNQKQQGQQSLNGVDQE